MTTPKPPGAELAPPWILFTDGKAVAILPAGRPGEVADVSGLSLESAQAIVDAANSYDREQIDKLARFAGALTESLAEREDPPTGGQRR